MAVVEGRSGGSWWSFHFLVWISAGIVNGLGRVSDWCLLSSYFYFLSIFKNNILIMENFVNDSKEEQLVDLFD